MADFISSIYVQEEGEYLEVPFGISSENIFYNIEGKTYSLKNILDHYFSFMKTFNSKLINFNDDPNDNNPLSGFFLKEEN